MKKATTSQLECYQLDSPYTSFAKESLILRDQLAVDRSILASERTMLGFAKVGVMSLLLATLLFHLAFEIWFQILGGLLLFLGIFSLRLCIRQFRKFMLLNSERTY